MFLRRATFLGLGAVAAFSPLKPSIAAPQAQVLLPLQRTVYQTNEQIDVSVVRSDTAALPADNLSLTVAGNDGSRMVFNFPAAAVPQVGADARATEHLHLDGRLLRPGKYTITALVNGATATADIEVFTDVRKSPYRLVTWGRDTGANRWIEGEDSMGFNLFYGAEDAQGNILRGGMDSMSLCTMSGGHQMDLRPEADWSDPYVVRGGTARVVRQAFRDRTRGDVIGVHFYDEPGLTWVTDPITHEVTPHGVPSQLRSYTSAFGVEPLRYFKVDAAKPEDVARWKQWATWKLGFMDAAWQDAKFGVNYVRPDYLTATQSQYGWTAFTDGYYFNVVRSLPIISGHGGYDDYWLKMYNPSWYLEMSRARDFSKPNWYLPTWYGNTTPERFRAEQYLCFITGIQGMETPPDLSLTNPAGVIAAPTILESNKLMARLGTIFVNHEQTRPPVAMLYSMSEEINAQAHDPRNINYANASPQGANLQFTYLAGKQIQQPFLAVTDEDLIDGTVAAHHKAIILTTVHYLDPKVITALNEFAAHGGLVLTTADTTVKINGAIDLGVSPHFPDQAAIDAIMNDPNTAMADKYKKEGPYTTLPKTIEGAAPLAQAIKAQLDKAGIKPVFNSDQPGIAAYEQVRGDIDYLFGVNTSLNDVGTEMDVVKPVVAAISIPDDGRPVYDAVVGGPAAGFTKTAGGLTSNVRFGPGQLHVWARTARPIGGIRSAMPVVSRDLISSENNVSVAIAETLVDNGGAVLSGAAPLEIRVIDPVGNPRYDLYRATDEGVFKMSLPLALNDPTGTWTVTTRELLSNKEDTTHFVLAPTTSATPIATETTAAIIFGRDPENVNRFLKTHSKVTIVKGTGDFEQAAADRLVAALKPLNVQCSVVNAADVNHSRSLTADEAPTWIGLDPAKAVAGAGNGPNVAGFAIAGPVILLGNPDDNPLMKFLQDQGFLPYAPDKTNFPGRGRGMVAWQYYGVGHGQESVTLTAYDAEGMTQAVDGMLMAANGGKEAVTPHDPRATLVAAKPALIPELPVVWSVTLPDSATQLTVQPDGPITATTRDGSVSTITPAGVATTQAAAGEIAPAPAVAAPVVPPALTKSVRKDRVVKFVAQSPGYVALGYWGGTLDVFNPAGELVSEQQLPQDITGLGWAGMNLIAGLADGRVMALRNPATRL